MADPLVALDDLGPIDAYRTADHAAEAARRIEAAQAAFRAGFEQCRTDRERARYALEVTESLITMSRKRACNCELMHNELACENVDMFQVLADWLDFAKARV